MTTLSLTYKSSSANLDFYRANNPDWYVEVLIDYLVKVDGKYVARKPPHYRITAMRRGKTKWIEAAKFTYTPTRTPAGGHLADSTVTRLVREALTKKK